jgi:hypothetical protein
MKSRVLREWKQSSPLERTARECGAGRGQAAGAGGRAGARRGAQARRTRGCAGTVQKPELGRRREASSRRPRGRTCVGLGQESACARGRAGTGCWLGATL